MGGKGGSSSPPPSQVPDNSQSQNELMAMMFQLMQSQNAASIPEAPELPAAPEIERNAPIDFRKRQAEILKKTKADFEQEKDRKHGTNDSIHTSPLLDEDDDTPPLSLLGEGPAKTADEPS